MIEIDRIVKNIFDNYDHELGEKLTKKESPIDIYQKIFNDIELELKKIAYIDSLHREALEKFMEENFYSMLDGRFLTKEEKKIYDEKASLEEKEKAAKAAKEEEEVRRMLDSLYKNLDKLFKKQRENRKFNDDQFDNIKSRDDLDISMSHRNTIVNSNTYNHIKKPDL